jgi:hypothetical protein
MSGEHLDADRLRAGARDSIESYRTFLNSPAFQHQVDLAILVKVAGDESVPMRERLRAAEILAKLRLEDMAAVAELTGVREQSLDLLGIKAGPQALSLTNVHQKIEIVRAKDWRALPDSEVVDADAIDVDVLPAGEEDAPDGADRPP